MHSLATPGMRKLVADRIKADVEAFCQKELQDDERTHLGGSQIGEECARRLWYDFRWCNKEEFSGQKLRLFKRGHREEHEFLWMLRGIGCKVYDIDPATGQQFRIEDVGGHFGGSCDAIGELPAHYEIIEPVGFEFKTNKTGADFKKVIEKGVSVGKPQHWGQICVYGRKRGLRYWVYCIVDKNTDTIEFQVVELDWKYADELIAKARMIITAPTAPEKLAPNPSFWKCKPCPHLQTCHYDKPVNVNCRSCQHSAPIDGKQWNCNYWNSVIPGDAIAKGCPQHKGVK